MKKFIVIPLLFITTLTPGQQPPGTEIYLFDLTIKKNNVSLSNPQNITNRTGYDNRPFFHPDKPIVYYASANDSSRTDIHVYNYQTGSTQKFTDTQEREYSPTVTPDKKFISCILQRDNGAQDLVKYPIEGGYPQLIINNLIVGYHAWVDQENLVLFVLGQPNSLRWYSVKEKKDWLISDQTGRSIHKIPGSGSISFVDKTLPGWIIKSIGQRDGETHMITPTLHDREDFTWTPDRKILMSDGEKIMYWQPGHTEWISVEFPETVSLKGISRLAVNTKGNKLAVVVSE